ncbi:MAG TPA: hypothetical protein VMO76_06370 [Candidatus Udaeobacter sp.]|nr:hypothetical protein [Candidatus Udaeobacter sp.]
MLRRTYFLALSPLLGPVIGFAGETPDHSPAFTAVPELTAGFDLLYEQKFAEAREVFASWESCNSEDPFGEVAVAASYLFEELHLQGVLTSDFFLNEKRFLHGIDGRPDPERMSHFREALARARELARERQKTNPGDGEALFALTLSAGMESDAESILQKNHMSALMHSFFHFRGALVLSVSSMSKQQPLEGNTLGGPDKNAASRPSRIKTALTEV